MRKSGQSPARVYCQHYVYGIHAPPPPSALKTPQHNLGSQDMLGAPVKVDDFVVAGTSAQSLYGTCEAFFRVGMEREELFRAASRCLLSALERDCLSGYGAVVHLITEEGIETRELATRMD